MGDETKQCFIFLLFSIGMDATRIFMSDLIHHTSFQLALKSPSCPYIEKGLGALAFLFFFISCFPNIIILFNFLVLLFSTKKLIVILSALLFLIPITIIVLKILKKRNSPLYMGAVKNHQMGMLHCLSIAICSLLLQKMVKCLVRLQESK